MKLGAITLEVVEKHELKISAPAAYATYNLNFLTSKTEHIIFSERHDLDGCTISGPRDCDLEWATSRTVSLPQDLETCTQDVSSNIINIHHLLVFTIELQDANKKIFMVCWFGRSYLSNDEFRRISTTACTDC
jgi:hypothetical protein